ncbi:MAG: AraC family transcriptional regulator [Sarcina sp.]
MDINKFYLFNLISDITVKEKFGPFIIVIEPGSLCRFDSKSPTNRLHSHNHYELCFVIDGIGEYRHDNKIYNLKKGDIFISTPKSIHEISLKKVNNFPHSSTLNLIFFRIYIEQLNSIEDTLLSTHEEKIISSFLNNHKILISNCDYMFSYMDFLLVHLQKYSINNYGIYNMVKAMTLEALFELSIEKKSTIVNSPNYPDIFNKLLIYIESNLDKSLTVENLAEFSFTSQRNIHYMFNKYLKKTPKEYINHRKINQAKLYLKMNYKVKEVSLLIGIDDLGQFSRLFKKHCGISPKTFQKSKC